MLLTLGAMLTQILFDRSACTDPSAQQLKGEREERGKEKKHASPPLLPHSSHILVYSHVSITHRDYSSLSSFVS